MNIDALVILHTRLQPLLLQWRRQLARDAHRGASAGHVDRPHEVAAQAADHHAEQRPVAVRLRLPCHSRRPRIWPTRSLWHLPHHLRRRTSAQTEAPTYTRLLPLA